MRRIFDSLRQRKEKSSPSQVCGRGGAVATVMKILDFPNMHKWVVGTRV